jgi:acetyl-CoA carboxylase biotin carboxyl carrier protein
MTKARKTAATVKTAAKTKSKPSPKLQPIELATAKTASRPVLPRASAASARGSARGSAAQTAVEMVRDLAAVMERRGLSEVHVQLPDAELTLRRGGYGEGGAPQAVPFVGSALPLMPMASPMQAPVADAAAPGPAVDSAGDAGEFDVVHSPFVGTFYRSPSPDAGPFVEVGGRVEKGQVLCIVEAMKLMNEIEAERAGVITEILVGNGEPVEYGQPLFKISPA